MRCERATSGLARGVWTLPLALTVALAGCSSQGASTTDATTADEAALEQNADQTQDQTQQREAVSNDTDGEHAITASAEEASYTAVDVTKTGEADGDEADFYGVNSAVYAEDGATLSLSDITVTTSGTHANAVFSYGEGTTVTIDDSTINTMGNCSGGIMVTGGGTLVANDLNIHTTGNSSAAIRSDRGGGTQTVTGGTYTTDGTGSPVIYSTADVTVTAATLESTASQGVVVEGKNSVSLVDCDLTANNVTKNSDKSDFFQAIMIYQSMSGDAAQGEASFSMEGGSLTNLNGDILFVNNTVTGINLTDVAITNKDDEGVLLRAAAAGWGREGSNGGHVTLTATEQQLEGTMLVDSVSTLNLYLAKGSTFTGTINPSGDEGRVYVEIAEGSTWTLTEDAHITSLTCGSGAIDLNGHTLYVGGVAYEGGTAQTGEAIEVEISSTGPGGMDGQPPEAPPDGGPGFGPGPGGEPPAKPGE